jgi:pantoate--beta-alanine ligase
VTTLISTRDALDAVLAETAPTAVVMTMGALHEGHAELMREARRRLPEGGRLIVTDFVNPTQFGAGEDFDRYPRTLEADVKVCERNGVDIVFAPSVAEVYGGGDLGITVDPGPRGAILEGASRPGHFAGVLTVVAKLMHMTRPDIALFGEKDYQQLVLIRDMATALDFGVEVIGVPTVREPDGLAMSSRNRYLSASARALASDIPRALAAGQVATRDGVDAAISAVRAALSAPGIGIDYVACTDVSLGDPVPCRPGRLLAAVVIDGTRLIDNVAIEVGGAS